MYLNERGSVIGTQSKGPAISSILWLFFKICCYVRKWMDIFRIGVLNSLDDINDLKPVIKQRIAKGAKQYLCGNAKKLSMYERLNSKSYINFRQTLMLAGSFRFFMWKFFLLQIAKSWWKENNCDFSIFFSNVILFIVLERSKLSFFRSLPWDDLPLNNLHNLSLLSYT